MTGLWLGLLVLAGPGPQAPLSPAPSPSPSPSAAPSALEVPEPSGSFGEVYEGAVVRHRFAFRNRGSRPVRITEVRPVSSRGQAAAHPAVVPAGGEGYVEVEQPTEGRLGLAAFRFSLRADDGSERKLGLAGFIQSAYEPERAVVDFGTLPPGGTATLEIFSREVERLEVREVAGAPAFLTAAVDGRAGPAQEGIVLRLTVRPDAPLGFHSGTVRLRTNVERQPDLGVVWRGSVYEDVLPSESPLDLGVVREGKPFLKVVQLQRLSGAPLEVERVDGAGAGMTTEVAPCLLPSDACRVLRLSGVGPAAGSPLGGTLTVVLKGSRPVSLAYSGILVGPDTTVKEIGPTSAPEAMPPVGIDFVPPSPRPLPAAPAPVVGRPGERQARLTWEARQEEHAYGYLVYRSERREGPFVRLSPEILKVSSGEGPHVYRYVDERVEPGRTYYYYIESVDRAGTKARLSGVMTKVIPPEEPR